MKEVDIMNEKSKFGIQLKKILLSKQLYVVDGDTFDKNQYCASLSSPKLVSESITQDLSQKTSTQDLASLRLS